MSLCAACDQDRTIERDAIQGRSVDADVLLEHVCDDARPATMPRPVLVLAPGAEFRSPHRGTQVWESFRDLARYFARPLVAPDKAIHGGLVLGRFRDGVRRLTHFEGTSMLGLDFDEGEVTAEKIHTMLAGGLHVVYSTFSSTPAKPKSRAVLFLDREIDAATHKRVMRAVYKQFEEAGVELDPAAKDATRWWFCPIVHPDRVDAFRVHVTPGHRSPFFVDKWLAKADQIDRAYELELEERRRNAPRTLPASSARLAAYARAALASSRERVLAASDGGRHDALNREAHSLARAELALTEDDIADALVPAFLSVAGPEREREALRTVRDAVRARGV